MKLQTLLPISLLILSGCAAINVTSVSPSGGSTKTSAYVPAWPWQDSNQTIASLNAKATTNSASLGLRGGNQSEITNTNAVNLIRDVVAAAVGAAVGAAK